MGDKKENQKPIITKTELIKAVVFGIVWGLTYLYIRRYLNPEIRDDYKKFTNDAIFGSIAFTVAFIAKYFAGNYIASLKLDE